MQNPPTIPINNSTIVYDLQLYEGGYPMRSFQESTRGQKAQKILFATAGIITSVADALLLWRSFPEYDFSDFVTFLSLGLPATFFLILALKKTRLRYFHFDEEEAEWCFSLFDKPVVYWKDLECIYLLRLD